MGKTHFDTCAAEFLALDWPTISLEVETELIRHVSGMLTQAARWAEKFDVHQGWYKADYGRLLYPSGAPEESQVAEVVEAARARGLATWMGREYAGLMLKWAWALDHIDAEVGPGPYDPLMAVFEAGGHLMSEHGSLGMGLASVWIGPPSRHTASA